MLIAIFLCIHQKCSCTSISCRIFCGFLPHPFHIHTHTHTPTPTRSVIWDTSAHVLGHAKRRMQVTRTGTGTGTGTRTKARTRTSTSRRTRRALCKCAKATWQQPEMQANEFLAVRPVGGAGRRVLPAAVVKCPFAVTQLQLNILEPATIPC